MALRPECCTVYVALCFVLETLFTLTVGASAGSGSKVLSLLQPYDFLYYSGVRAYYGGEWVKAAELLEKSIQTKEALLEYRKQCYDDCLASGNDALQKLGKFRDIKYSAWCLYAIKISYQYL